MSAPALSRFAFNAIPWFNRKADPADPDSEDLWLIADPAFAPEYPRVLAELRSSGFDAAPLGVLPTQTIEEYLELTGALGLRPAPGYVALALPEDHGASFARGSREWSLWFDGVRRQAEHAVRAGLDSAFLAPELDWGPRSVRANEETARGAAFDAGRLERVTELLADAAEILRAAGVRAGLHNHVGTWVETEEEINAVLGAVDASLLGASLDVGHIAWTGADPAAVLERHRDRIIDLHLKDLDLDVARRSRERPTPYQWAPSRGLFREPGDGDLDLDAVLAALPDDFDGWVIVEVDRTELEPVESARRSRRWAERVAG